VPRVRVPKEIIEKSSEEDQDIEVRKRDFVVLLLGYGYPEYALDLRIKAKEALRKRGFDVYIMREIETKPNESLNDKFRRILDEYCPQLFLILVSQEVGATGVSYEVSLLVERYGRNEACKMIRICAGKRVDLRRSFNQYITELDEIIIRKYEDNDFDDMVMVMENTIIDAITSRAKAH
jgi:hypothetical protein